MFSRRSHVLKLLLLWMLCGCFILLFPFHTSAATNPISITTVKESLNFPQNIDFLLSARDIDGSITTATIFIKYNAGSFDEQHTITPGISAANVDLTWHDALGTNRFTPANTHINYYWTVQDNHGHSLTGETHTIQIVDTRFNWQHLSQGQFQINWYNRPLDFGQTILTQVNTNITQISSTLGVTLTSPINIWIYQNSDDFRSSLPPDTHEWTGGIAFTTLNQTCIVVEGTNSDHLVRDMPHELTHLIFHQGLTTRQVPLWFDEGLAVYNQIFHEPEMELRFEDGLNHKNLITLSKINSDFPADSDQAYLAYAQSWKLLDYMYTAYGQAKMTAFIRAMHSSSPSPMTFSQYLQQVLHTTIEHLENDWHLSLGLPSLYTAQQLQAFAEQNLPPPTILATVSTTDRNDPALFMLGLLLVVLPLTGYSSLLIHQHRLQHQVQLAQQRYSQSQTIFPENSQFQSPQTLTTGYQYTDPKTYYIQSPPSQMGEKQPDS